MATIVTDSQYVQRCFARKRWSDDKPNVDLGRILQDSLRNRIIDAAYHKGLLILGSGENTVRFCPPLVIDEEQAEFAVRTLGELIEKEAK